MAKRDYRSYNILRDELQKTINLQVPYQKDDKVKRIAHIDSMKELDTSQKNTDINRPSTESSSTKLTVKVDKNLIKDGRSTRSENKGDVRNNLERERDYDTSFSTYKDNYQKKERSRIVKWAVRLSKFIIILMLLPFIGVIGSAVITFLGIFMAGIIGSFGIGILLIGITSFFATQISVLLIVLGITTSITAISFGAILTILFIMMIKQVKSLIQKYRKPKRTRTIQGGK